MEVVGIGSWLRGDDAVGLHLVEGLAGRPGLRTQLWEDRDALDLASLLLDLDAPVLLVDCAHMGIAPGQWRAFAIEQAELRQHARSLSTHGFGLADGLALARELGFRRPLRIFGVQPFDLSMTRSLSAPMRGVLDTLQDALWRELEPVTWPIELRGRVQGVGMRPRLKRLADQAELGGWVQNRAGSVRAELAGPRGRVLAFVSSLAERLPPQARLDALKIGVERLEAGAGPFVIRQSDADGAPAMVVPADLVPCGPCLAEIFDPGDRRFGYAFTTCTDCGPRYSVVTGTPYDRANTTLSSFPLCARCEGEYEDPTDRRFHAESIACPDCGPRLWATSRDGDPLPGDPLILARLALARGEIVALRGVGGFLLAVDAQNRGAIERLRQRKQRPHKPLAVMARDLSVVETLCELDAADRQALSSSAGPIVLLDPRPGAALELDLLSPDAANIGLMLPSSPLHALLFSPLPGDQTPAFDLLVMTSGNRRSEPICTSTEDALERLDFADLFLTHDRPIALRCDDSVLAWRGGALQPVRRARGQAPEPIILRRLLDRCVLALGAGLKNTVALGFGDSVLLSPHIGDPSSPQARAALQQVAEALPRFLRRDPQVIAVDLHPDLASTRLGEQLAESLGVELVRVQHHHAHAAAAMAEHGLDEALALVYDGVGFGEDGALWGGELLHVDPGGFQRLGHFAPAPLPGGDAAVIEPLRQLVGRCVAAGVPVPPGPTEQQISIWSRQCERGLNAPSTHAVGRLFDAAAAALGLAPSQITWEGQAAVRLEAAARRFSGTPPRLDFPVVDGVVRWQDAWPELLACDDPEAGAAAFHQGLARASAQLLRYGLERVADLPIVLSGGVFQNGLLLELLLGELSSLRVLVHAKVPCNDGGIALGQVVVAGS